jgi:hypothetical protein
MSIGLLVSMGKTVEGFEIKMPHFDPGKSGACNKNVFGS